MATETERMQGCPRCGPDCCDAGATDPLSGGDRAYVGEPWVCAGRCNADGTHEAPRGTGRRPAGEGR